MHRVTRQSPREVFAAALERLPLSLRWLGEVTDLFTEEGRFAGLANYPPKTFDGRDWAETGHVFYPPESPDRRATVVMPPRSWAGLPEYVHEIGHVLDYWTGLRLLVPVVTEYGATNGREAFAEWVCAWTCDEYRGVREKAERDEQSRALWATLAAGRWENLENFG